MARNYKKKIGSRTRTNCTDENVDEALNIIIVCGGDLLILTASKMYSIAYIPNENYKVKFFREFSP